MTTDKAAAPVGDGVADELRIAVHEWACDRISDGALHERILEAADMLAAAPVGAVPQGDAEAQLQDAWRELACSDDITGPTLCGAINQLQRAREKAEAALASQAARMGEWQPIETAPYATSVLAWLHLPKNPIASSQVIAQRCYVEVDDPDTYAPHERQTVGCWWANGRYYDAGHVTHWMPLPAPPAAIDTLRGEAG